MACSLISHLDETWQRRVDNVRRAAERLWARPAHRNIVDHGPEHSDRVIALLGGVTEGLMAQQDRRLASEEIYILLAAAYLHALGLQDEKTESDAAVREKRYPELSAEMIYRAFEFSKQAVDLGLVNDPSLVEMVALVVRGQQRPRFSSSDYDDLTIGTTIVRPRLLAALFCLANNLDLDYHRVDLEQFKLAVLSLEEALRWWLHYYVSGVRISDEYIRIDCRIPADEPAYEALPRLVESQLRAVFHQLRDTLRDYGVKVDIASSASVRPMRAVLPMPSDVWAVAERRLVQLGDEQVSETTLPPLVEVIRGLLRIMGYECRPSMLHGSLVCINCLPKLEGKRSPLLVGCTENQVDTAQVHEIAAQLGFSDQQGYLITEKQVLQSARDAARTTGQVRLFTLSEFYSELFDFKDYVEQLVEDYEQSELGRIYVSLSSILYSYDIKGRLVDKDDSAKIDEHIDKWLRGVDTAQDHNCIFVRGDYGAGKTSFCREYAARQGHRWLADPIQERIPVLVDLRNWSKEDCVADVIVGALGCKYSGHGEIFDAFMHYNRDGKLLIIFDGLDEIVWDTGKRTIADSFGELATMIVPRSKVVLTSRTLDFFIPNEFARSPQEKVNTTAEEYVWYGDHSNLNSVCLEPFTHGDVRTILQRRFPTAWKIYWDHLQNIPNLLELAYCPAILGVIAQTLPGIEQVQPLNAAQLYYAYTSLWLDKGRIGDRFLTTPAYERLFVEELAMGMLHTGESVANSDKIMSRINSEAGPMSKTEIEHLESETRKWGFLDCDETGNYRFSQQSFAAFFAACYLHRRMLEDDATTDSPVLITEDVRSFLKDLFDSHPKPELKSPFDPPEGFVWIPPGEFVLGDERELDLQISRLEDGFFSARKPVTNAQYWLFIQDGGYNNPAYWTENGWQWKEARKRISPYYWERDGWNDPHQPVVTVSWYEATAYCNWLTQVFQALDPRFRVRLPTEREWERAVRGYDGRFYPWGMWIEGMCNTDESGIGKTTPVGKFSPQGDSIYGLQDAVGNVWEWTNTEIEGFRILRGGSFLDSRNDVRCSSRKKGALNDDWQNYGFRTMISISQLRGE